MKTNNFEFVPFSIDDILKITNVREGELKLGECISAGWSSGAKYVLIGVSEDVGPQSNGGNGGSQNAFRVTLSRFLNMQSNRFYNGSDLTCLGYVKQLAKFTSIEKGKALIEELDELLIEILVKIYQNNQIPILIGGGHNNAYALIAAFQKVHGYSLDVINCDPHADCRRLEGRHSGNPFSYAKERGFLDHYSVLGLHRAYNSENMLNYLDEQGFYYSFYEDYLDGHSIFLSDLQSVISKGNKSIGVELDLDSIKGMPTSAYTPSGFEVEQVRKYIINLANSNREIAYLHLPEGAPSNELEEKIVGKTIAYLIHDFLRNRVK